jgi:hypothetical protein
VTLRITVVKVDRQTTQMRLEGRFTAADLPLLETCLEEHEGRTLVFDLAALRWLDEAAVARLSDLIGSGARVAATSPYVDRLLARIESDAPTPRASAIPAPDCHGP